MKDFLPRLALSNQHLQQAVENGENVDIENVENVDGPLIQMVGTCYLFISSPEPLGSQGELIGWP